MKVFITGMGVSSSLGNGVTEMFTQLCEGKSGVRSFPEWQGYAGLHSHVGAPAPAVDIKRIPRSARRTMSRMSEFAVSATLDALAQAELSVGENKSSPRTLLCMGSTFGSPEVLEEYFAKLIEKGGPEGQLGTTFFKVMNHTVAANVAAALGFRGPSMAPSSACTTSAQAMILGWELIQSGLYDTVIAGGADELHYTSCSVFDIVQAASRKYNDRPDLTPRPFDTERDGLVVSEGAGVIILESEDALKRRKGRALAEFKGGAYICEGSHMSQSSPSAMIEVMQSAMERARIAKDEIDYVNAHATATIHGDIAEAQAIREVFGAGPAVSSLKGHLGHSLAACATIEVIASVKMLEKDLIVPTRNLQNIDPLCAGPRFIREIEEKSFRNVLSNNFAFGGLNTCLILSKI